MLIKEFISQLEKLNPNEEIYVPNELELKEPIIQTLDFKFDTYHLLWHS